MIGEPGEAVQLAIHSSTPKHAMGFASGVTGVWNTVLDGAVLTLPEKICYCPKLPRAICFYVTQFAVLHIPEVPIV